MAPSNDGIAANSRSPALKTTPEASTDADAAIQAPAAACKPAAVDDAAGEKSAASEPASSSLVESQVPGSFAAELWHDIAGPGGIYSAILGHPFLAKMADGTLDEASFRYYIAQDSLYLREYARALSLVASKAPRPDWTAFFCKCSQGAYEVESGFHEEFLAYFGSSAGEETAAAAACPNSLMYTSWMLSTIHQRSFYEGLAAVLPCFVVYLEVGKALKRKGSPHPLYQQWIEKYGGLEYESLVLQVIHMANEVAAELSDTQKGRMQQLWRMGCRLEYTFFDAAYRQQQWPV
ncbi:Aminopyrimidine aminohydrolase [Chlorella vulgaris]